MDPLNPQFIGNSIIALIITYIILFAFNIYVLYLNWKQSKVNDQMKDMLSEVSKIREILENKKKK